MPTYITLKDVKKRWGHGQEDVFPVTQFEKLWGDMTALPEIGCGFVVVPRRRGQQLKDQAQLDGWLRDGSAAYVESLCAWSSEIAGEATAVSGRFRSLASQVAPRRLDDRRSRDQRLHVGHGRAACLRKAAFGPPQERPQARTSASGSTTLKFLCM